VSKKDDGVVNIHGKQYLTVARRTNDFRERHPDYGIHTEILSIDDATVVCRAVITDEADRQISSGIAEESRTSSRINQTSAVENCETSAVGRALAFFGMAGTEIASADEVAGAISQQNQSEVDQALMAHAVAVRENLDEIHMMKTAMQEEDYMTAAGIYMDWDEDTAQALRRAPSKGGVWTTQEVTLLRADGAVGKCVATIKKQQYAEANA
jgi:hypothetical protein